MKNLVLIIAVACTWSIHAQLVVSGDAVGTTCGCADLTQDTPTQLGTFTNPIAINLGTAFSYTFQVNFGDDDTGGEGLAFVIQAGPWTTGSGGYGLGYQGISGDVLAIEFDTRDNDAVGEVSNDDVAYDHISLQDNGDINNDPSNPNNLLGIAPANIKSGFTDVEDGSDYEVQISWTPGATQTLEVMVDGVVSLTYTADMISSQFSGNPLVFWGWTASTSANTNTQSVCMIGPSIDIEADANYCEGDVIADLNVISVPIGTVNWYDNPSLTPSLGTGLTFSPSIAAGTYTYYATEMDLISGCEGPADSVEIIINPIAPGPIVTGPTEYCEGDLPTPLSAETSFGGSVTWYNAPPPALIVSTLPNYNPPTETPGTYTYYVTETVGGCEGAATAVTVIIKPIPIPPTVVGDTIYCEGEGPTPLNVITSSGGTFEWLNDGGTVLGTGSSYTPTLSLGTTYIHIVETLDGCSSADSVISITVAPDPQVDVPDTVDMCRYSEVTLIASHNGYDLLWSTFETSSSIIVSPPTSMYFSISCTNPDCGFTEDSVFVLVHQLPNVVAGTDTSIGLGGEVQLWASSSSEAYYDWFPAPSECIDSNCANVYVVPDQATVYIVTVIDEYECENKDTVLVDILGKMEVFVPNIFSPNGDGFNDFLEIKGPRLFNFNIEIYDRWGKRVFKTDDPHEEWDGRLNDQELAPQTFVYKLSGETILGEVIVQEGNITIIK